MSIKSWVIELFINNENKLIFLKRKENGYQIKSNIKSSFCVLTTTKKFLNHVSCECELSSLY